MVSLLEYVCLDLLGKAFFEMILFEDATDFMILIREACKCVRMISTTLALSDLLVSILRIKLIVQ